MWKIKNGGIGKGSYAIRFVRPLQTSTGKRSLNAGIKVRVSYTCVIYIQTTLQNPINQSNDLDLHLHLVRDPAYRSSAHQLAVNKEDIKDIGYKGFSPLDNPSLPKMEDK